MGTRSRPQNPAPKRQLWLLLETDKQHPSGRVGLYRARIGTLAYQYRARATPSSNPRRGGGSPGHPSCLQFLTFNPVSSLRVGCLQSLADRRPGSSVARSVLRPADAAPAPNPNRLCTYIPSILASQPSCSLLLPPGRPSPLSPTHTNEADCSRRAATRSVPVRCLLHLALSTPTPCCPKHFETANRSLVHLAVIVQLSGDRYPSPAGPWRQACLNGVVLSRLRRLCAAYVYPANIYCQSPSRPSPRCCEPLHCLECE